MNKISKLGLVMLFLLLMVPSAYAASCGNLSSVSLFAPNDNVVTGTLANATSFQGLWTEVAVPPTLTNCRLEIYDMNNNIVNFTGDPLSATRSTLTTFPVDKDSFNLFYQEGIYLWNIACEQNVSNVCVDVYAPANRTITFDFSGPQPEFVTPSNDAVYLPNVSIDINVSVNDTYDNGSMACSLYIEGSLETSQNIANGTQDTFTVTRSNEGSYDYYVTCTDNYGNAQNTSLQTFIIDNTPPVLSQLFPANNTIETQSGTVSFNFTVTDTNDPNSMSCDLLIDSVVSASGSFANGSAATINYTFSTDGTYQWQLNCSDPTGNSVQSAARSITVNVSSDAPILWDVPVGVNSPWIDLIGYLGKPGSVNVTIANNDFAQPRTNSSNTTNQGETNASGTLSITQIINQSFFRVEDDLGGNLSTSNFIAFAAHNLQYFLHYQIVNVIPILDYFRVDINPQFNDTVVAGDNFTVYDADRPSGWFNVSIELYPGTNNLTLFGVRSGIEGTQFSTTVYYDTKAPWFNTSNLSGLYGNTTLNFTLYDDFNVSLETLLVNVTNATNASDFYLYAAYPTLFNTTTREGNITCVNTTLQIRHCSFLTGLDDGSYNITFMVNDSFGQTNSTTVNNVTLKLASPQIDAIQDLGVTTGSTSIFVNWTVPTDPYLDFYELSVGSALGVSDVVDWFTLESNYTNYSISHANLTYGEWYFVNIRATDTIGQTGDTVSTDGITIEDTTPPQLGFVTIAADSGSVWVDKNGQLTFSWNFTDNESSVVSYEYAIGTAQYPFNGWDDEVLTTATIQTNITATGLTLQEGETYYVSVKARNTNLYGGNRWSDWYSSSGVTVDTQAPENGYLTYSGGATNVNFVNVSFLVGNDSVSGVERATLLSRKAALSGGSCSFSGAPDYSQELNATIIGSMTPQSFVFNNLENGYCYRFALDVYDYAGNSVRYGINQITTVSMDYTAPSGVTVTDDGLITATTNMYFEWTESTDNESTISYYEYALGTTSGNNDVVDWTNNGLIRTVTLMNDDYATGHLADEQIYYLTVRAWNAHNTTLFSESYSDGILYLDFVVPDALTVISVANDTDGSDLWFDNSTGPNVSIILQGETGLSCVWSYFDVDYVDATETYVDACSEISGNNTYYNCTLVNVTDTIYDVSVACQDEAGNKQTSSTNTDLKVYKDTQAAVITFTSPTTTIVAADDVTFSADINETSVYTASYQIYNATTNNILESTSLGTQNASSLSVIKDYAGVTGEFRFAYTIVDAFGRTANNSIYFIVNDGEPFATVNQTSTYINETGPVFFTGYFYTNFTYEFANASGVQVNGTNYSNSVINRSVQNLTINISELSDGNYTLTLFVEDGSTNYTTVSNYVIDTLAPTFELASREEEPSPLYEDNETSLYLVFNEENEYQTVYIQHNASGTLRNETATEVAMGLIIYPDQERYKATISPSYLTTATTFEYRWVAVDQAGNQVVTANQTLSVTNRAPQIVTPTLETGLQGISYVQFINFTDEDSSQNNVSFFDCAVNDTNFGASAQSSNRCMLNWSNPVGGNYTLLFIVYDLQGGYNVSNDTEVITVEILPSVAHSVSVDSNSPLQFTYDLNGATIASQASAGGSDVLVDVASTSGYVVNVSIEDEIDVIARNVSVTENATALVRELNVLFIENSSEEIGLDDRYVPYAAYAIELNYSTTENYSIEFPFGLLGVAYPPNLQIFQFDYDNATSTIDYDTGGLRTTVVSNATQRATTNVSGFSAFILVESQDLDGDGYNYTLDCRETNASINPGAAEVCYDGIDNDCDNNIDEGCPTCSDGLQNGDEDGVDCGGSFCGACVSSGSGGSGGGGGGGGGSSSYTSSTETCEDGIQNQNEIDVDCGGVCGSCFGNVSFSTEPSHCYNGVQDFGESGVDCGNGCTQGCVEESTAPEVPPLPSVPTNNCNDGLQNGDETGVDCGGSCASCVEETVPPSAEEPQDADEQRSNSWILFLFIGLLVAGGIVMFVIRSDAINLFASSQLPGNVRAVSGKISFSGASDLIDDDIGSIARYIGEKRGESYKDEQIKDHLEKHGYSNKNIDAAINALLQEDYVQTVNQYLEKYGKEGFSPDELQSWLLEKNIDPGVIAVAMDRHKRKGPHKAK